MPPPPPCGGGGGGGGGLSTTRYRRRARGDSAPLTPTLSPQERGEGAPTWCPRAPCARAPLYVRTRCGTAAAVAPDPHRRLRRDRRGSALRADPGCRPHHPQDARASLSGGGGVDRRRRAA